MKLNVYNLTKLANITTQFPEINIAIVNNGKIILSDNDACHSINNLDDIIIKGDEKNITGHDIIKSEPVGQDELGSFVRVFGRRIENNYQILLKSIEEIGLNPKDFPRSK